MKIDEVKMTILNAVLNALKDDRISSTDRDLFIAIHHFLDPQSPVVKFVIEQESGQTDPSKALRFNAGKPRLCFVPKEATAAIARAFEYGARKYAARNWEKGGPWTTPYDSLMRHAQSWADGENKDPESGLSHLDHLICNAAILSTYEGRAIGKDDREEPTL